MQRAQAQPSGGWAMSLDADSGPGARGAVPPSYLDTKETPPQLSVLTGESVGGASPSGASSSGTSGPRHEYGIPVELTEGEYRSQVAAALRYIGLPAQADSLEECGKYATVYPCGDCGTEYGAVQVRVTCRNRACPGCARRAARDHVQQVESAVRHIDRLMAERRPVVQAKLLAESVRTEAIFKGWREDVKESKATLGKRLDRLATVVQSGGSVSRLQGLVEKAEREVARVTEKRDEANLRKNTARFRYERTKDEFSWKMVTIGAQWDPTDVFEYRVKALGERLDEVLKAFQRLLAAGADVGGLAAASLHIEISLSGHIHAHVLYYGPFITQKWWQRNANVGAKRRISVDVRAIYDKKNPQDRAVVTPDSITGGLSEAVKYALKAPSMLDAGWVAGMYRKRVMHPRMAARLQKVLRGVPTLRHYGLMRAAMALVNKAKKEGDQARDEESEMQDEAPRGPKCCECGARITTEPRRELSSSVARALRGTWGRIVTFEWGLSERVLAKINDRGERIASSSSVEIELGALPAALDTALDSDWMQSDPDLYF